MKPIPMIIPARGGSKGIPRKNVLPLAGVPLIGHLIQAGNAASLISEVYVTTDDSEIAEVSRAFGAIVIERPAALADDVASSEAALLHAIEAIEELGSSFEVFCFGQCTSPLTTADDLSRGIQKFYEVGADSLFSSTLNHKFIWKAKSETMVGINHNAAVRLRRQELEPEYAENGAFYVMRKTRFQEAKHRFFGKIATCQMPSDTAIEIDEPEDFELIEQLMQKRTGKNPRCLGELKKTQAIIFDFDGVFTDDRVWVDENGKESAVCSRSDGMGIERLRRHFNGPILILSKETNPIVKHRANKLKIDCLHGVQDKLTVLTKWSIEKNIPLDRIAYIGNDINDLECINAVGFGLAPADAQPVILENADLVLSKGGGQGAVREFCELILGCQQT